MLDGSNYVEEFYDNEFITIQFTCKPRDTNDKYMIFQRIIVIGKVVERLHQVYHLVLKVL